MGTDRFGTLTANNIQRRTGGLIGLVGVVVAVLILSSYHLGSSMIERNLPLIDAVMELELNLTSSHLWFEELISGDPHVAPAMVDRQLDSAERYADLMLSGGVYKNVTYYPIEDDLMRQRLRDVRDKLAEYREIMKLRLKNQAPGEADSSIDEKLDTIFRELISEAEGMNYDLHEVTEVEMRHFYLNNIVLFILAVAMTFGVGVMVRRFVLRQAYGVHLLERANLELASEVEKRKRTEVLLERQATTDHLTGILNRTRMSEVLEDEWARMARYPETFALIMFDIDHFKRVNDLLGHHAGDRVLVELTHRVKRELRDIDAFARWGGEEFLILLPQTDAKGAEEVAERCRKAFSDTPIQDIGTITASFGVVAYSREEGTLQRLLQRADAALYEAKHKGRDRVNSQSDVPS